MDIVTCIEKYRGKMKITINDTQQITVPSGLYRERPLSVEDTLDLSEYEQWLMIRQYRHALDRAVAYLSIRARSQKEVETKLLQGGYLPATVEMVLYKLRREGILDDESFASQWAQSRLDKGQGKAKVARELSYKGIDKDTTALVLDNHDESQELHNAKKLVEKWMPRYEDESPMDASRKLIQALVRRGYTWSIAKSAVSMENEEE